MPDAATKGSNSTPSAVPMLDLRHEVAELWDEITEAVHRVLRSGHFIGGDEVEAFEEEAAAFLGVKHAIGLNSGTDALVLGLEALGIGPGDEVITTPFSFFATSEAVLRVGATPVFADIDGSTLNIDPDNVEAAITERTKAILPVHLFGLPADMPRILDIASRHGLLVLEDCAQAFGARCTALGGRRVGSFGALSAFSFYPTKNLGAYGDAGMIATNDDELAARVRSLRNHGSKPNDKYQHERIGHNSRLDALQAAILRVKLPHIDGWNEARRSFAGRYDRALRGVADLLLPPLHRDHVFHQYTVQLIPTERPAFEGALRSAGIAFARFYPAPLTAQPHGSDFGLAPAALCAAERTLSVPIYPTLDPAVIERVAEAVASVTSRR